MVFVRSLFFSYQHDTFNTDPIFLVLNNKRKMSFSRLLVFQITENKNECNRTLKLKMYYKQ